MQDISAALVPEIGQRSRIHEGLLIVITQRPEHEEGKLNLPDVVQENIGHHFGSCYNGALGFIESAGVVFNVAHLPH